MTYGRSEFDIGRSEFDIHIIDLTTSNGDLGMSYIFNPTACAKTWPIHSGRCYL